MKRSLLMAAALVACGGGVSDSVTPPVKPDSTPTDPGGTVQRTSLTVRVQVESADAAIANLAGVTVSGLGVRLTRQGSSAAPLQATTDATGTVKFENLLDGTYTASVERVLSTAEIDRLAPADREANVFAGGITTPVSPPNAASATVPIVAARRGSLVISEVFTYQGSPIPYNWSTYLELYNNGDTTVYLDGMFLGRSAYLYLQSDFFANCDVASYLPFRNDTNHIWVFGGIRFPGTGQQYPVPPGEARVYAPDALNHRTASGSALFPDLSSAQFEHVPSEADTENPTSSNVAGAFGTTLGSSGRGLRVDGPSSWILARSTAADRLASATLIPVNQQGGAGVPLTPKDIFGIPSAEVLDVISLDHSPSRKAFLATTSGGYSPPCTPWLPSVFERAPAELNEPTAQSGAFRRRSLGRTIDGREILMRTRTSARDLEVSATLLQRSLNK